MDFFAVLFFFGKEKSGWSEGVNRNRWKCATPKKHTPQGRRVGMDQTDLSGGNYAASCCKVLRRRLRYAPTAPATKADPVRISVPGSGTEAGS